MIYSLEQLLLLTSKHVFAVYTRQNCSLVFRPRRSRSAAAYSDQTFPSTICRSVRRSVCPVDSEKKTADRTRMTFGIIGRTGPRTRQVVGFGDLSTERGTFGGEFGARHCKQWGLYGVGVRQRRDAALFPNYFGQTCYLSTRWSVKPALPDDLEMTVRKIRGSAKHNLHMKMIPQFSQHWLS